MEPAAKLDYGPFSSQWEKREQKLCQGCSWHIRSVSLHKGRWAHQVPSHSSISAIPRFATCTDLDRKFMYCLSHYKYLTETFWAICFTVLAQHRGVVHMEAPLLQSQGQIPHLCILLTHWSKTRCVWWPQSLWKYHFYSVYSLYGE